jgi:2-aminoadipate transaminase
VAPRPVLEKLNLGKQGADLCSSPVTQMFVAAYFREQGSESHPPKPAWIEYVQRLRDLYRTRRDVMLEALEEHLGGRASWTKPGGGLFVWATLDGNVDTTDLLARSEGVAFVPGRAAYVDGRSGSSSMRLNFAGVPEAQIREGVRRIGQAMGGQAGLFGALTGTSARGAGKADSTEPQTGTEQSAAEPAAGETAAATPMADVVQLPRRADEAAARRRHDR